MILRRIAIGATLVAAPLVFAAPAMAGPGMNFDCAPCVGNSDTPIWDQTFANGPWEPFFDSTNGVLGDKKGAWESGVEAVNGGAWEKAFPPAPE
ncbi:hypothetical protein [Mycolicibacterium mageritense]|uniref:hypothetical protein n=1 Tax=Mycolicibacterium mageritense TaxID=53462 RepID=UPI00093F6031|nr:hypothetical protein [Mycolicibacterium mageritense]OKH68222.1 hypothetical protein EB73_16445 [Mycobacterium sp. SWH-M3]TXI63637.1 MAG: hypothetical protein E6Q55_09230 [Mycolicibacterium mageritense]